MLGHNRGGSQVPRVNPLAGPSMNSLGSESRDFMPSSVGASGAKFSLPKINLSGQRNFGGAQYLSNQDNMKNK